MCLAIRPEHTGVVWSSDVSYLYSKDCRAKTVLLKTADTERAGVAVGTYSCITSD